MLCLLFTVYFLTSQGWESSRARHTKGLKLRDISWVKVGAGDGVRWASTARQFGRGSGGNRGGLRGGHGGSLIRHDGGDSSGWMIWHRTVGKEIFYTSDFAERLKQPNLFYSVLWVSSALHLWLQRHTAGLCVWVCVFLSLYSLRKNVELGRTLQQHNKNTKAAEQWNTHGSGFCVLGV